jgi:hypothetical protein
VLLLLSAIFFITLAAAAAAATAVPFRSSQGGGFLPLFSIDRYAPPHHLCVSPGDGCSIFSLKIRCLSLSLSFIRYRSSCNQLWSPIFLFS